MAFILYGSGLEYKTRIKWLEIDKMDDHDNEDDDDDINAKSMFNLTLPSSVYTVINSIFMLVCLFFSSLVQFRSRIVHIHTLTCSVRIIYCIFLFIANIFDFWLFILCQLFSICFNQFCLFWSSRKSSDFVFYLFNEIKRFQRLSWIHWHLLTYQIAESQGFFLITEGKCVNFIDLVSGMKHHYNDKNHLSNLRTAEKMKRFCCWCLVFWQIK